MSTAIKARYGVTNAAAIIEDTAAAEPRAEPIYIPSEEMLSKKTINDCRNKDDMFQVG